MNVPQPMRRRRAGTAAIELTLVAPLLLVLGFACSDLARMMHAGIVLSNAARVGADYGATHRFTSQTRVAWEQRVREAALEELQNLPDYVPAETAVSVRTEQDAAGWLRVVVSVEAICRTVVPWPGIDDELVLRSANVQPHYR